MTPFRIRAGLLLAGLCWLTPATPPAIAGDDLKQRLKEKVEQIAGYLTMEAGVREVRLTADKGLEPVASAVEALLAECQVKANAKATHELRIHSPDLPVVGADPRQVRVWLTINEASKGFLRRYPVVLRGADPAGLVAGQPKVDSLARKVVDYLAAAKEPGVKILYFQGPAGLCNIKMTLDLHAEIGKIAGDKVKVGEGARLTLQVVYSVKTTDAGVAHHYTGTFRDANNDDVHAFKSQQNIPARQTDNSVDPIVQIVTAIGFTGEVNPAIDNVSRMKSVAQLAGNPTGVVGKDGVARGAEGSPYGMQLVVDKKPRAVAATSGRLHTTFEKSESYTVLLRNDSEHDACVSLWIDGLSMFHFSEEGRAINLLIPKGRSMPVEIPGWFITRKLSRQFQVMSLENTPAGKVLAQPTQVGTVTAVFARAYAQGETIPKDEYALNARINQSGELATGVGRDIAAQYQAVDRYVGAVRCSVTVRYTN